MFPADLYLAIGSNLGNRAANISRSVALLEERLGCSVSAISPVAVTKSIGFSGPDFLNCIVRFRCSKAPLTILKICKEIEREMGRTDSPEYDENGNRVYHNRIIDIDILLYGRKTVNTPELTIPHPQIETRPYVKELLSQM